MQAAHCEYGLQLDMNPGHTGFEFYRVERKGSLPDVGRKLDSQWEARGEVPGNADWEYMGRRMIRYMNLMHFPRYIRTESRDFFYLTERRLLPLPALESRAVPKDATEGTWQTQCAPEQGWPPAVASTRLRPDATRPQTRISLVTIDAKWLRTAKSSDSGAAAILSIEPNESNAALQSIWSADNGFTLSREAPTPTAKRLASGVVGHAQSIRASAAMGELAGGIWVYAEMAAGSDPARDASLLDSVLRNLDAKRVIFFGRPLNLRIGASAAASSTGTRLFRVQGPGGVRIFQQTPVVAPREWLPLQERRIRYMKAPRQLFTEPNTGTASE
jgi:hypothetical protein